MFIRIPLHTTSTSDTRLTFGDTTCFSSSSSSSLPSVTEFKRSYLSDCFGLQDFVSLSSSAYANTEMETPIVPMILNVFMHCVSSSGRPQKIKSYLIRIKTACLICHKGRYNGLRTLVVFEYRDCLLE